MANSVFKKQYILRGSDFDCFKQINPRAVLDLFQEVAGQHAEELGIGFLEMLESGLLWVVLKVKYQVIKKPSLYQNVTVTTWPMEPKRLDFQREYLISDEQGNTLIKGTSQWAVISSHSRKLTKAQDAYKNIDGFLNESNFNEKLTRVGDFVGAKKKEVKSEFSHIDSNGHVNNAKYGEYVIDALMDIAPLNIKEFQIDFHKEILVGQTTDILTYQQENTVFVKGVQGEDQMFLVKIERE